MERRLTQPDQRAQHRARTFERYLLLGKANRESAKRFSRLFVTENKPDIGLSRRQARRQGLAYLQANEDGSFNDVALTGKEETAKLDAIKQEILDQHQATVVDTDAEISVGKRVKLLLAARSKRLSGLSQEQTVRMYEDAGYSDKDIEAIMGTGKKLLKTSILTGALTAGSEGTRGVFTFHPELIPQIDQISGSKGALASIGVYLGSYGLFALQNLRFTKDRGYSADALLTGIYIGGNRYLPPRTRDMLAFGVPVIGNILFHGGVVTGLIEGTTGNTKSVVAGNIAAAAVNTIYSVGGGVVLRRSRRKREKTSKS